MEQVAHARAHYISVRVRVRFIVTAGQHFTGGRNDTSAPYAPTSVGSFFAVVESVCALLVSAISWVRDHERMPMTVVVQLCGFEDESVGA